MTTNVETHKSFIPFSPGTFADCPPGSGEVVRAQVARIDKDAIHLDRQVNVDGQQTNIIKYAYLVIATGTKLSEPSTLPGSEKLAGTEYLRVHAQKVISSSNIVLIGAGAVGVQMATDIKELYPEKNVTLVHSRNQLMNRFHSQLNEIVRTRCEELGVHLKTGSRVKFPQEGFSTDGRQFDIEFEDGTTITADFAIVCTGMTPQSSLINGLAPSAIRKDAFISTKPTLQIESDSITNVFAVGDVANTGAHKAARPGARQAQLVTTNIEHLEKDEQLETYTGIDPPAIHLTLGISKNVIFGNPAADDQEPRVKMQDNGRLDMGIDDVWVRRGGGNNAYL